VQHSVLGSWCKYCVVADGAALLVAAVALAMREREPSSGKSAIAALPVLSFVAAGAFFAPVMINRVSHRGEAQQAQVTGEDKLPEAIAREQRPGVATIVEYLDFECPYCRQLHARLEKILPEYGDKVRVVRKMLPLSMHVHAEQAARAYCCADDVGKAEEMANALMHSENLTSAGCEQLADKLGIDLTSFRECITDKRTAERIKLEMDEARAAGVRGLPTYWIGKQRFSGLADEAKIRAGIDAALRASGG
jgi:protein-disulfide isomerase